jgi:uncharacterized protein YbcI
LSTTETAAAAISRASVQILREHAGRGPTAAKTIISQDAVIVLLGGALTTTERNLVARGMDDQVRQVRDRLQMSMRHDLIAIVEEALGRRAAALLSDTDVHADVAIQVFTLVPVERDMGRGGTA